MVKEGQYIYKVSQLTSSIKIILEDSLSNIWVEGEISNFRSPSSGHFYFTLKDEKSELKCVSFKSNNEKISFDIKDGMHVICGGRISVYEKQGAYQLYVSNIEPKGVGALQLAFNQLKERLFKEGLFDEARKRPIPKLPEKIGIVTSPTGAAIRDILHVLKRRFSNVEIIINPVKVQGETAREEISQAIEDFNKLNNVDVIIVGRGGGSLEDLWAFNEEIVARAVYNSRIPVISAVGHEIDWMITDFVADLRAPTPSAAAEMVIPEKKDLEDTLQAIEKRLRAFPSDVVKELEQRLDDIERDLVLRFRHYSELKEEGFRLVSEKLAILSPLGILGRGYSITFKLPGRKIIKDARSLKIGDSIETRFSRGNIKSRVEELG
ncbi:MAG: exodeoxyribonuclease VII large subunit [Candidatus Omnitrophica bacterium]|nr:exodeoxyribonuclease VII large subunit [Candidatus Omnitrophota bacterium]MBU1933524.1 exodeoxyribonuclease VII large subunit [Candidatus Omnitrophota bacterium]